MWGKATSPHLHFTRYRAEHLFGEKARLLSTYAWLTLTGVNIALFVLSQACNHMARGL